MDREDYADGRYEQGGAMRYLTGLAYAGMILTGPVSSATGAEIRVLGTGAVQHSVIEAVDNFSKATGHKVVAVFGTAGAVAKRIEAGERADVYLSSLSGIRDLQKAGHVLDEEPVSLGRVRIAVGVRKGATKPDVGTVEKLKAVLLAAPSFAYGDPASGATTGIHFARILQTLGIDEEVKGRAVLRNGGLLVMKEVADGKADLGVTQASEILAVPGTEIAGYLPDALQLVTVYAGQLAPQPKDAEAAKAFLDFLSGTKGREIFAHHGFDTGK